MDIKSCEIHINQALDMFVADEETFPIMTKIEEEKKLSTKCDYCEQAATYLVANE